MKLERYAIEMLVPADMDPSALLEKLQEVALEFAEQFGDEDEDPDGPDGYDSAEIENAISVQPAGCPHDGAYHTAGLVEAKTCEKCHATFL